MYATGRYGWKRVRLAGHSIGQWLVTKRRPRLDCTVLRKRTTRRPISVESLQTGDSTVVNFPNRIYLESNSLRDRLDARLPERVPTWLFLMQRAGPLPVPG